VLSRPAGYGEFRVLRIIPSRHMVVVLEQHLAFGRYQNRTERLIALLQRDPCELDTAPQMLHVRLRDHVAASFDQKSSSISRRHPRFLLSEIQLPVHTAAGQ